MSSTHILVFPFPAQGHMIPLLDFTDQIIRSRNAGEITITILVTPKNLPLLNQILSVHPSIQTLVLPFPSSSSIPLGAENAKDLKPNSTSDLAMMRAVGGLHDPLIKWFRSHPSPPVAILSDMFLGWTHRLAADLGIRRIVFSPSGALALSVMFSMWRDLPTRRDPNDQNEVVSFGGVPNCPKYPWWQLSPLYRSYVEGDPDGEFFRDAFLDNLASWGLVVNSFGDLEGVYLEHLRKETGHIRVWAVGPVKPIEQSGPTTRGGPSSVSADSITSWLDKCDDLKVVYVCFGTQAVLSNDEMEALALGLERSGVRFVWSIKEPAEAHVEGGYGRVPQGFDDRVAGRGLVIKGWAPQVLILNHRAVGAFLTHCGWNSVLESVTTGVPILAWPMGADQFINAALLDQLKLAIRVCEGEETVSDSVDLARVLVESVREDDRAERQRAKQLREAALRATVNGGSSVKDVESFIVHLVALGVATCK
ncbi:UDP-glycosyltransferase 89B2 isoform X2 [Morus notabilis]|uniref:UDP-glycosyltransferase 89B2 isoform X2 n=1 Tax=Morus notabilis TaxID=981085 RepID=UPI000CED3B86|nr:UDP-glycosyltransferase 89B2 isoform X2 [Morus notabilis]